MLPPRSLNSRMQYHTAVFIAGMDMDVEEGVPHAVCACHACVWENDSYSPFQSDHCWIKFCYASVGGAPEAYGSRRGCLFVSE